MASVRRTHTSISIHAPTRGATNSAALDADAISISIHAPTRGATGMRRRHHGPGQDFNPRSHERSDPMAPRTNPLRMISIHAPTRGATALGAEPDWVDIFQSTLPREERLLLLCSLSLLDIFQSTLPREERRRPRDPTR